MLVAPARRFIFRLRPGFSAATKKVWNIVCSMKAPCARNRMRPYTTHCCINAPCTPSKAAICGVKAKHSPLSTAPAPMAT